MGRIRYFSAATQLAFDFHSTAVSYHQMLYNGQPSPVPPKSRERDWSTL